MNKLRIGMVGMGFIADWHFQGFADNPEADIVAMTQDLYGDKPKQKDLLKRLHEKCKQWNIQAIDSFDEMVTHPDIDALIIGSINPLHFEQIKIAIANKKQLMVEKPVVINMGHMHHLKSLVKNSGVKLFPAHNFVYRNAVIKAKEIIESGRIGRIVQASFLVTHTISQEHAAGWRTKKELAGGGALMESGLHLVYQSLFLLGKPIKVQAFTSNLSLKQLEGEDIAQVSLLYPDNSMAVIMQSWASNYGHLTNGIRIIGAKGEIAITDALYLNNEKLNSDVEYGSTFINQAKAFTDYIFHNKPPLSTLDDAEDTLKIIQSAYRSADEDRVINL
ncbi:MAG TPA: Gfo/Idh/MocA family oxidoreductase [Caldithrix sp.]|nr:Gfo/Idh/MocA family oxidoreductase [Calditrichaceae bacterium]HEM49373.1 Gfo/Idh/MocA family oxidoreductase [Caldithrix sp.]